MAQPENGEVVEETKHISHGNYFSAEAPSGRLAMFARWIIAVTLRLFLWYTILTALFRCPSNSTELDGFSPQVCGPYLNARSNVEPYVTPYYETYAAPYIEAVQPYADNFHKNIYTPTKSFSLGTYRTYGAPQLEQSLHYLGERWTETITPRLHATRDSLVRSYSSSVRPHIVETRDFVVPRYQAMKSSLTHVRDNYFSPYCSQLEPGISRVYSDLHDVIINQVLPRGQKLWIVSVDFVNGTLRPRVARLYLENVEPQLVKIGNKLREGKGSPLTTEKVGESEGRIEADTTEDVVVSTYETANEAPSETPSETPHEEVDDSTATLSNASTDVASDTIVADIPTHSFYVSSSQATDNPQTSAQPKSVDEEISNDLQLWQDKFAIAADDGCEYLEEQVVNVVQNITDGGYKSTGEKLLSALEVAAQNQVNAVKAKVIDIVRSLPEEPTPEEKATSQEQLLELLRSSGAIIREPAHALREWFNDYDGQLVRQVTAAVASTLEVLDGIRDLGLQEIGMRWAWMEGVTYKDWAKFHDLKRQLSEWRDEVSDVGMQHEALVNARNAGNDILSRGMFATEAVSQELTRLKEVAMWKFEAGDDSDDFDSPIEDPAEFRVNKKAAIEREIAEAARRAAEEASDNVLKPEDIENLHFESLHDTPISMDEEIADENKPINPAAVPIEVETDVASDVIVDLAEHEMPSTLEDVPDSTDSSGNTASAVAEGLEEADPNLQNPAGELEQQSGSYSENTASIVAEELEEADPNLQNPAEELEQQSGSYSENTASIVAEELEEADPNLQNSAEDLPDSGDSYSENTASVVAEELEEADPNLQNPAEDLTSSEIEAILDSAGNKLQAKIDVIYKKVTDPRRELQDNAASILDMAAADLEDAIAAAEDQLNIVIRSSNDAGTPASDDQKLQGAMKRMKLISNEARAQLQELSVRSQEYATWEAESIIQAAGTGSTGNES